MNNCRFNGRRNRDRSNDFDDSIYRRRDMLYDTEFNSTNRRIPYDNSFERDNNRFERDNDNRFERDNNRFERDNNRFERNNDNRFERTRRENRQFDDRDIWF